MGDSLSYLDNLLETSISRAINEVKFTSFIARVLEFQLSGTIARNRSIFLRAFTSNPECPDIKNTIDCACIQSYIRQILPNLVPRAFSSTIFKMADRRQKTLAHSELTRSLIGAFYCAFIRALSLVYSFEQKWWLPWSFVETESRVRGLKSGKDACLVFF